jgi:hypothetical protein
VKGVFEEGDYNANGGEMAELKAWVMSQLLWNPRANPKALRDEFLRGYYGRAAAPVRKYVELLDRAGAEHPAHIFDDTDAGYLSYPVMREAERVWSEAELKAENPEIRRRVRVGHLAVRYVWLRRWTDFRREAARLGDAWPLPATRKQAADEWLAVAKAGGPDGWTPVNVVNESNQTAESFAQQVSEEPPPPPVRHSASAPVGITGDWIDAQDVLARIWNEPTGAAFVGDPGASDGGAVRMPGSHHEWAFQLDVSKLPQRVRSGRWRVLVVARMEGSGDGVAFTAGVWDTGGRKMVASKSFSIAEAGSGYRAFDLGPIVLPAEGSIWVAPPADPRVRAVWVDRVYFLPG